MNRILLTSSLAVSAAIIAAHEKGISKSEIFHVSNWLDQLDNARNLIASPTQLNIKISKCVEYNYRIALVNSKLTRGQIAYCIAKHLQTKKTKKKGIAAKVTVKSRTVISTSAADIQKRIKFSAPLKVVTANVVSSC
jgi:DNA-binding CsgD family transcriptional regulator